MKYLAGYARRPYLWRDLLRQPGRLTQLRQPRESSAREAEAWAYDRARPTAEVVEAVTGAPFVSFRERHAAVIAAGEARTAAAPVRLGGAGDVDLLYALTRHFRPDQVVETGVAFGWSSLAILTALDEAGAGHLASIDRPDMAAANDSLVGLAVPAKLRARWSLNLGVDRDVLPRLLAGPPIQLAHYDSDKSYFGKIWAMRAIWAALPAGAVLVVDDITNNTAFRDFCDELGLSPLIASSGPDGSHIEGIVVKG